MAYRIRQIHDADEDSGGKSLRFRYNKNGPGQHSCFEGRATHSVRVGAELIVSSAVGFFPKVSESTKVALALVHTYHSSGTPE